MTGRYFQFQVDGRRAGPVRDKWHDAAQDAVNAGMAQWTAPDRISLDDQAAIARFDTRPKE